MGCPAETCIEERKTSRQKDLEEERRTERHRQTDGQRDTDRRTDRRTERGNTNETVKSRSVRARTARWNNFR